MNILRWGVLGLFLVAAQTSLTTVWRVWLIGPDLLVGTIILLAVYGESEDLFFFAPALGYVRDLYSAAVPGTSVLVFFLLVWFIRREKTRLDFDSYLLGLVVTLATLFDGLASLTLQRLATEREMNWALMLLLIIGRAAYTLLLVEIARFLWKNFLERRLAAAHPGRRRFRELHIRPPSC